MNWIGTLQFYIGVGCIIIIIDESEPSPRSNIIWNSDWLSQSDYSRPQRVMSSGLGDIGAYTIYITGLYICTAASLGDICMMHAEMFQIYVDGTEEYLLFTPGNEDIAIEKV